MNLITHLGSSQLRQSPLAGYPLSSEIQRPFNAQEIRAAPADQHARMHLYNQHFSSKRILVEHAFGRLKNRFPILKSMRGYDVHAAWQLIVALLVLHNIITDYGDPRKDMEGWESDEEGNGEEGELRMMRPEEEESLRARERNGARLHLSSKDRLDLGKAVRLELLDILVPPD